MFVRIGFKSLSQVKSRTILAILALILGTGLITGINILSQSYIQSYTLTVSEQLGYTDIAIREYNYDFFNISSIEYSITHTPGYMDHVGRIQIEEVFTTQPGLTEADGYPVTIWGIDVSGDVGFGRADFVEVDTDIGSVETIEDILKRNESYCVITEWVSNTFNLHIGDIIYVPNATCNRGDSGTWMQFEVKAVILDIGEGIDFSIEKETGETDSYILRREIFLPLQRLQRGLNLTSEVNMVYVHVSLEKLKDAYDYLNGTLPEDFFVANAKEDFLEYVRDSIQSMIIVMSVFATISLLVSAILIYNVLSMSIHELRYYIGILRAIGSYKKEVFIMAFSQALFLGITGSTLGCVFGVAISPILQNIFYSNAPDTEYPFKLTYVYDITTILISLLIGFAIAIIAGISPAISATKTTILESLRPSMKVERKRKKGVIGICGFVLIILGCFLITRFSRTAFAILSITGLIPFVLGLVIVIALIIGPIAAAFSFVLKPIMGFLRKISIESFKKGGKRTTLTFMTFTLSLAFLIIISTTLNSLMIGYSVATPRIVGAQMRIVSEGTTFGSEDLILNRTDKITAATVYATIPVKIDGIGRFAGEKSKEPKVILTIINPRKFASVNHEINVISGPPKDELFAELEDSKNTIILWEELSKKLKKDVEDNVTVEIYASGEFITINATLNCKIIGVVGLVSGIRATWQHPWAIDEYVAFISWQTIYQIIDNITKLLPEIDFMIKADDHDAVYDDKPYFNATDALSKLSSWDFNYSIRTWSENRTYIVVKEGTTNPQENVHVAFFDTNLRSRALLLDAIDPNYTTIEECLKYSNRAAVITNVISEKINVNVGENITIWYLNRSGAITSESFTVTGIVNLSAEARPLIAFDFHVNNPFYLSKTLYSDYVVFLNLEWANKMLNVTVGNNTKQIWIKIDNYYERHIKMLADFKDALGYDYAIADLRWVLTADLTYTPYWLINYNESYTEEEVIDDLKTLFLYYGYIIISWQTADSLYEQYAETIEFQKNFLTLIMIFAIIIGILGIAITTIMSVRIRVREIGILRAIGTSKVEIVRMILGESLLLSLLGMLFGFIIGLASSYFMIKALPLTEVVPKEVHIDWISASQALEISIIAAVMASLYPAYYALRLNIIEAIRRR